MAGLDIATGQLTDHDSGVLPLDATGQPGVQQPTAIQPGGLSGPTYPGVTTVYADQVAADEAACTTAMHQGMDARTAMTGGYEHELLPLGSSPYQVDLPTVPEDATAPASDFLFSEGDQPGKGT